MGEGLGARELGLVAFNIFNTFHNAN